MDTKRDHDSCSINDKKTHSKFICNLQIELYLQLRYLLASDINQSHWGVYTYIKSLRIEKI